MKKVKIFRSFYESDEFPVKDFDVNTIKPILDNQKFIGISLEENDEVVKSYSNGIIITFDEVMSAIEGNPKYSHIKNEIDRHRAVDNKTVFITGYGEYTEKILFTPYTSEFKILYKKPLLITDLITDFRVDNSSLSEIKQNSKKYKDFYLNNRVFLNLFDRFLSIIIHHSQLDFFELNFEKFEFDYFKILDFFECYEVFFKINNFELYEFIKERVMKKAYDKFSQNLNPKNLS